MRKLFIMFIFLTSGMQTAFAYYSTSRCTMTCGGRTFTSGCVEDDAYLEVFDQCWDLNLTVDDWDCNPCGNSSNSGSSGGSNSSESCTVSYTGRSSYYDDPSPQTITFSSRYSAEAWISNNRACGSYRCDGQDLRWAAENISLYCHY